MSSSHVYLILSTTTNAAPGGSPTPKLEHRYLPEIKNLLTSFSEELEHKFEDAMAAHMDILSADLPQMMETAGRVGGGDGSSSRQ